MSTVGSANNVQWGFEVGDTSVVEVGGVSAGMIDGGVTIRVPRTVNSLRADQYAAPIDGTVVTRDAFISWTMKELLGNHLTFAWDSGSYSGSSVVVDSNEQGNVAVVVVTAGPDGSTRTITAAAARAVGDGTWNIPFAAAQSIEVEYQCFGEVASSGRLLYSVDS